MNSLFWSPRVGRAKAVMRLVVSTTSLLSGDRKMMTSLHFYFRTIPLAPEHTWRSLAFLLTPPFARNSRTGLSVHRLQGIISSVPSETEVYFCGGGGINALLREKCADRKMKYVGSSVQ